MQYFAELPATRADTEWHLYAFLSLAVIGILFGINGFMKRRRRLRSLPGGEKKGRWLP